MLSRQTRKCQYAICTILVQAHNAVIISRSATRSYEQKNLRNIAGLRACVVVYGAFIAAIGPVFTKVGLN